MDRRVRVAALILVLASALVGAFFAVDASGDHRQAEAEAAARERRLAPPRPATPPERFLGRAAARIAGRPVTVLCDGDDLPSYGAGTVTHGIVWFYGGRPANYAVVAPNLCRELLLIPRGRIPSEEAECLW